MTFKLENSGSFILLLLLIPLQLVNGPGVMMFIISSLLIFLFLFLVKLNPVEYIFFFLPAKYVLAGISGSLFYSGLVIELMLYMSILYILVKVNLNKISTISAILFGMVFFAFLGNIKDAIENNYELLTVLASIRSSLLPLITILLYIEYFAKYQERIIPVTKILIQGVIFVSIASVANYFFSIYNTIESQAVYPYLQYFGDNNFKDGRFIFGNYLPRLNLLYAGAIGSLAALQIIIVILAYKYYSRSILLFSIVIVAVSSFMTMSYSILLLCLFALLVYTTSQKKIINRIIYFLIAMFGSLILLNVSLSSGLTLMSYIINQISMLLYNLGDFLNPSVIIFGHVNYDGTSLVQHNIDFGPKDIGIFRGFLDHGIFFFSLNLLLFFTVYKLILSVRDKFKFNVYFVFLLTLLFSQHGNLLIKPIGSLFFIIIISNIYLSIRLNNEFKHNHTNV
jgi:hypothetical protein